MSFKKIIFCTVLFSTIAAAPQQESFLAQRQPKVAKKYKKSLATMRTELVEGFEDYAHALVEELAYLSLCMRAACTDAQLNTELHTRYEDLQGVTYFFLKCDTKYSADKKNKETQVTQLAWTLAGKIAHVQEQLLVAMRQVLEQDASCGFIQAQKDTVAEYIQFIHTQRQKSEKFTNYLQSLSNKVRVKK